MLPSNTMQELSKRFAICTTKKLPNGYDVRYRQFYWLFIFDDRAELIHASNLSDSLTAELKKQVTGRDLPSAFREVIKNASQEELSLQDLERNYLKAKGSTATLTALTDRIDTMAGVAKMRLAQFVRKTAGSVGNPTEARATSILIQSAACNRQVINHAAFGSLRKTAMTFLEEYPSSAQAGDVRNALLDVGLRYSFDVPSKCRTLANRMSELANSNPIAKDAFLKHRESILLWSVEDNHKSHTALKKMKATDYSYGKMLARTGDSRGTLKALETGKSFGVMRPIHREWKIEAQQKLEAGKSSGTGTR